MLGDTPGIWIDSFADQTATVYQIKKTYIQNFIAEFSECEVQCLEDIIKYNEVHKDECLPPGKISQPKGWDGN